MSAVWITRRPDGSIYAAHECDPTGGDPLAFGWTVTRETLLTPEQAAVIAAAKAFADAHGAARPDYAVIRDALDTLVDTATTLRAQEGE